MATEAERGGPSGPASNSPQDQKALSLHVTLPHLLDLALGTPEVGAVNFNILHHFLHVVLHLVNLRSAKVEYRGDDANRLKAAINTTRTDSTLQLHEYSISEPPPRKDDGGKDVNADVYTKDENVRVKTEKGEKPTASAPSTARIKTEPDETQTSGAPVAKKTSGSKQQIGSGANGERQSVIFVEPIVNGAAPTALAYKKLEETVQELQQRFQALDALANDPEIVDRMKGNKTDPMSDMWNTININKRLDACEKGIETLTTMMNDVMKSSKAEVPEKSPEQLNLLSERVLEVENQLAYLSGDVSNLINAANVENKEIPQTDSTPQPPMADKLKTIKQEPGTTKVEVKTEPETSKVDVKKEPSKVQTKAPTPVTERRSVIGGVDLSELKTDTGVLKKEIVGIKKDVEDLRGKVVKMNETLKSSKPAADSKVPVADSKIPAADSKIPAADSKIPATSSDPSDENPNNSESGPALTSDEPPNESSTEIPQATSTPLKPKQEDSQSKSRTAVVRPENQNAEGDRRDLNVRVLDLEKEVACINEKIDVESLKALGTDGKGGIGDLIAKVQTMRADMDKMNAAASRLLDEKENREFNTSALIEQIELLKTIKADKEDLEDALADKADAQAVNRKVSHDQFDAACDDLARGLEDAIMKLSLQESMWQQALDSVQKEIEGKLDKIEITPLKDFVNNRLKSLQGKLKTLAEMKKEREAAGTKKLLSDVQCISCDANVVMRTEEGGDHYRAPILPCAKSIKPYLTYELDQVRKQQRRLPSSRNMLQFEAAMREMARKEKCPKEELSRKSPRDHLCNRYCGGSHTITTPQQRVMRTGHYLTQWGPEAIQLTEGVIRGNDGQLYRSRPMPGKVDATKTENGQGEGHPGTPPSPSTIPEPALRTPRSSLLPRGRSSIGQVQRRSTIQKISEGPRDSKQSQLRMIASPPGAPVPTVADDAETVPELGGPSDQVMRARSGEEEIAMEIDGRRTA